MILLNQIAPQVFLKKKSKQSNAKKTIILLNKGWKDENKGKNKA